MNTTISNSTLKASIKHLGAELFSLIDNQNKEYIWNGNPKFWPKHSPVLFPIVGSLKNETYTFNKKDYHLSRHGFARDMEFQLIEKTASSATFSLSYNNETLKKYPFKFELQIIYKLEENNLNIAYRVINKEETQIPFSIGAHPAFALPEEFSKYNIQFEKEEKLEYSLLQDGLISNTTETLETSNDVVSLNYKLFKNDALVFKTLESNSLTILESSKPYIKVDFKDFPNLGIWTKENAPFICIEPWFGYSDTLKKSGDLFKKEGILILEANQTFNTSFGIEIF
ncbi:aldose 1-epimerase family protein [Flavobacterium pectinovorum]|uniref:aldose 1-epimerase family protein n=1 Tax=Flavobacterium pectinovorum TaxID=29533 RepID=UPI001FAC9797|nr:aldose 1-epimerase family protein [Flavobacterium pectinovorum]MCI9845740.1 aldose 1-epimerase family protein [Flavobacterium pectinovorum]